ncbi:MAG TPA: flagellar export protein FliJ, partial [Nitrosomonas europaea]|nr:flagellar export protein FliJ [Nitrosomonas europaea]
ADSGVSLTEWRNYRAFVEKLDKAIKEQKKKVAQTRQWATDGKNEFQTHRKKLKSYDTLLQRARNKQEARLQKQEQRQLDEHTAHNFSKQQKNAD